MLILVSGIAFAVLSTVALLLAFAWRRVVPPNMAHIVQAQKTRETYGASTGAGNSYYEIPAWIPFFGVTVIKLPVNNFDLNLDAYEAYDKDRAPFLVDVVGFFRIDNTGIASARVESYKELEHQLQLTMQGAVRTILAKHDIEQIMVDRATFGEQFTQEVQEGLKEWGVVPVRNLELMDIRDTKNSTIIADIMAKKSSIINMESRRVVAENKRLADIAEIEAEQSVDIREQEKVQAVGERTAQQERAVGIAKEQAAQEVQREAATTKQREMEVLSVDTQRRAEISREAAVVKAEEDKRTLVIRAEAKREADIVQAEGEKQQTILVADGDLVEAQREAEGIKAKGEATAEAERLLKMAAVTPELELATGIGANTGYQDYLVRIRNVKATETVGVAQAKALEAAEIKVISNSGGDGSLLGAGGGLKIGALLEGLGQTPAGQAALAALGVNAVETPKGHANGKAN